MNAAIIVAAGSSSRMGFDKLSATLAGRSVLAHSLAAFENCAAIDEIVVVTSADRVEGARQLAYDTSISKLSVVVEGGAERHLSVSRGIEAANPDAKILAVHDGARPLVTSDAIARCIETAQEFGAGALAHRVTDTLKRAAPKSGRVTESVDRDDLWAMETPQAFRAELLKAAYEKVLHSGHTVTDEVSALEAFGSPVQLVENFEPNPKITFPDDIALAEAILAARNSR